MPNKISQFVKFVKRHSPFLIFLIAIVIPFLVGIYVIDDDFKTRYSLILQIIGVFLLSTWAIVGGYTLTWKIIANIFGKSTEKNPWKLFEKFLFIVGTGFVLAGLLMNLF